MRQLKTGSKMTNDHDARARRRWAVEQAVAHNRIEGIETPPSTLAIFERWIAGEIDSDECTSRIKDAAEFVRAIRNAERY